MAAITEVSLERKRSARLLALAHVLSWAFVFFTILALNVPPQEREKLTPVSVWLALLVLAVLGALIVLSNSETIARLDADHQGRRGLAGWIAAGLIGGFFSGLTNLPFILNNEAGWASLVRILLLFGGPLVGYALAFRRNPITTFANLPPIQTPPWGYRLGGGFFMISGIIGLIISVWIVSGIFTEPGFRAPWGAVSALPASLAAIAFGWTFYHYNKPYDREAVTIGCLGLVFGLAGAAIAVAWLIWG